MQGMYGKKKQDSFNRSVFESFFELKTQTSSGLGVAGRVGAPGGAAGRGQARLRANRTIRPGNKRSTVPSKASKKYRFNGYPEARTSGTKLAFDHRFISGLSPGREARFVSGCRPVERRLFVFVNPIHARHVREPVESKPGQTHVRVGSGSPSERPGGVAQNWVPTELFARETKVHRIFQGIEETSLQSFSRETIMQFFI